MAINVSVQYNGGFLPNIILFAQCYYHRGTRFNAMKRFCFRSLLSHLSVLTFSPLCGNTFIEGIDAFRFFFKILIGLWQPAKAPPVWNYVKIYWPCAGGLSAVNAIGTQMREPMAYGGLNK